MGCAEEDKPELKASWQFPVGSLQSAANEEKKDNKIRRRTDPTIDK
jgi:hypothetical protein